MISRRPRMKHGRRRLKYKYADSRYDGHFYVGEAATNSLVKCLTPRRSFSFFFNRIFYAYEIHMLKICDRSILICRAFELF